MNRPLSLLTLSFVTLLSTTGCIGPTPGYEAPTGGSETESSMEGESGTADATTGAEGNDESSDSMGETGACDTPSTTRDDFESGNYIGGEGSWVSQWVETSPDADGSPLTGDTRIEADLSGLALRFEVADEDAIGVRRPLDLEGACDATVEVWYRANGINGVGQLFEVSFRRDAGTGWVTVVQEAVSGSDADYVSTGPIELAGPFSADSEIRVQTSGQDADLGAVFVNEVEINATL